MKTILVIDDNQDIRENIAEILELSSYQVFTANNGCEGVNLALEKRPEMIICDILMPEMNGYDVFLTLSKDPVTSHIPFIFLTALSEKQEIKKGQDIGAQFYLVKPFEDFVLLNTVEECFHNSKALAAR